jgi:tyrosyl-tRNA synthetase
MTINVNKMVKAGFKVKILMADWFARMERAIFCKTGGDLSQVQTIGRYYIETWKATGMDLDSVEFVRLSDEISCNTDEYWPLAMDIARKSDLSRIKSWLRVHASKDTRYLHFRR